MAMRPSAREYDLSLASNVKTASYYDESSAKSWPYDQSAAIRPQNTTGAWKTLQKLYDLSSGKITTPI